MDEQGEIAYKKVFKKWEIKYENRWKIKKIYRRTYISWIW
jgi:hypothetical protein